MPLPRPSLRTALGGATGLVLAATALLSVAGAADPTTGCVLPDPAGDATVPSSGGSDDGNLDILSLGIAGDGAGLTAAIKVVELSELGPDLGLGDAHEVRFTLNAKAVVIGSYRYVDGEPNPYASVGGTTVAPASLKAVYSLPTSTVSFSLSLADLRTMVGAEPTGMPLTALSSASYFSTAPFSDTDLQSDTVTQAGTSYTYAGACTRTAPTTAPSATATATAAPTGTAAPTATATATAAPTGTAAPTATSTATSTATGTPAPSATGTSTANPSASTPPAGTTLVLSGAVRVQHGDTWKTLATLKDSEGKPLAGKRLTARHGSTPTAAGTTDGNGRFVFALAAKDRSGNRALTVSFAGDGGAPARATSRTITTVNEVTRLTRTVSGSGSTRTVVIRLTDDDTTPTALGGRNVIVQFSGRSTTVRTDSGGRARVTVPAGAAMDITFTGQTGTYAPAKSRTYAK